MNFEKPSTPAQATPEVTLPEADRSVLVRRASGAIEVWRTTGEDRDGRPVVSGQTEEQVGDVVGIPEKSVSLETLSDEFQATLAQELAESREGYEATPETPEVQEVMVTSEQQPDHSPEVEPVHERPAAPAQPEIDPVVYGAFSRTVDMSDSITRRQQSFADMPPEEANQYLDQGLRSEAEVLVARAERDQVDIDEYATQMAMLVGAARGSSFRESLAMELTRKPNATAEMMRTILDHEYGNLVGLQGAPEEQQTGYIGYLQRRVTQQLEVNGYEHSTESRATLGLIIGVASQVKNQQMSYSIAQGAREELYRSLPRT